MLSLVPKGRCESEALALYGLARAALTQGDVHAARHHAETSQALFATMGHYRAEEVRAWLEVCGKKEQSREETI
jgi:DNA-binding transcriptional regulator YiaG